MSAKDVMKTIEEQSVKFIDFRFTDTKGKANKVFDHRIWLLHAELRARLNTRLWSITK